MKYDEDDYFEVNNSLILHGRWLGPSREELKNDKKWPYKKGTPLYRVQKAFDLTNIKHHGRVRESEHDT
ncbi:MAG: hypothetical protein LBU17_12530 [Treponema sp.]|jgi:hypothetical protein|nr:hypothetical protein [Treponema sp.]